MGIHWMPITDKQGIDCMEYRIIQTIRYIIPKAKFP